MKRFFTLFAALFVISATIQISHVFAFTEPTTAPANSSAPTPLDTSGNANAKLGGLSLNSNGATYGLRILAGNAHVAGYVKAGNLSVADGAVPLWNTNPDSGFIVGFNSGDAVAIGQNSAGDTGLGISTNGAAKGSVAVVSGGWFAMKGHGTGITLVTNKNAVNITVDGKVGVGTMNPAYALDVIGDVNVTGCYKSTTAPAYGTCTSDARLKENVIPITSGLSTITALNPVTYTFINEEKYGAGRQTGLLAQEVEVVAPSLVSTGPDGYKQVRYGLELQMQLIAAVKEQQKQIEELQARIKALEATR